MKDDSDCSRNKFDGFVFLFTNNYKEKSWTSDPCAN